jgi:hypothetical protein
MSGWPSGRFGRGESARDCLGDAAGLWTAFGTAPLRWAQGEEREPEASDPSGLSNAGNEEHGQAETALAPQNQCRSRNRSTRAEAAAS